MQSRFNNLLILTVTVSFCFGLMVVARSLIAHAAIGDPTGDTSGSIFGPTGDQSTSLTQVQTDATAADNAAKADWTAKIPIEGLPPAGDPNTIQKCDQLTFSQTQGSASGSYVPVLEVPGPLLSYTGDSNKQEGLSRVYNNDMCKYARASANYGGTQSEKTFVKDPSAVQARGVQVETYRTETSNLIDNGYKANPNGDTSKMFPENINTYMKQIKDEAVGVSQDAIAQTDNLFKNQIKTQIDYSNQAGLNQQLHSTMSKPDFDNFMNNGRTMSGADFWKNWRKLIQPQNNYFDSYAMASQAVSQNVATAQTDAQDDLIASQGFLPNRTCNKTTADGKACSQWTTISPGSIIKNGLAESLQSRLTELTGVQGAFQLLSNQYPLVEDIATLLPLLSRSDSSGGGGGNPNSSSTQSTRPPVITFTATTTTLAEIGAGSPNTSILTWSAPTAGRCEAANDWLTGGGNTVDAVKQAGDSLGKRGSLTIYLPLSFTPSGTRVRTTISPDGTVASTDSLDLVVANAPSANLITQTSFVTIPDVQADDVFTVSLATSAGLQSASVTAAAGDTPAGIAGALRAAAGSAAGFTFGTSGSRLTISSVAPTYKLTCINTGGTTPGSLGPLNR